MRSTRAAGKAVASPATPLPSRAAVRSLAEQVEIVVAGRAVGTDADIDTGGVEAGGRAKAAGQLKIGFRAMSDMHAGCASRSISAGSNWVMCTASKRGDNRPSFSSRASGRQPCFGWNRRLRRRFRERVYGSEC
jgi:hypothetical protein